MMARMRPGPHVPIMAARRRAHKRSGQPFLASFSGPRPQRRGGLLQAAKRYGRLLANGGDRWHCGPFSVTVPGPCRRGILPRWLTRGKASVPFRWRGSANGRGPRSIPASHRYVHGTDSWTAEKLFHNRRRTEFILSILRVERNRFRSAFRGWPVMKQLLDTKPRPVVAGRTCSLTGKRSPQ